MSPLEEWLTGSQRQLKPTAQSTTEFRHEPIIDALNGLSGSHFGGAQGMAQLASVFCLLFVFCVFFNGLGCDGHDNALEEC